MESNFIVSQDQINKTNDMQRRLRVMNAMNDLKTKLEFMKKHINQTQNRILEKTEKLKKYEAISQSVSTLLDNYPSGDKKIDKYILETVSCVQKLPLLNPGKYQKEEKTSEQIAKEKEEFELNKGIQVLDKMLNAVLKLPTDGSAKLSDLFSCENMYTTILYYAEEDESILECQENEMWKKNIEDHKYNLQHAQD